MEPWVKFLRGTAEEYKRLPHKNEDTLYFVIQEEDSTAMALYLGSRLISGSGSIQGAASLDELTDVVVTTVGNRDILQYDSKTNSWINVSLEELLKQIKASIKPLITSVNEKQFVITNGELGIKSVELEKVNNLQQILDTTVKKEEGSRLINEKEIAALSKVIGGEFDNFIKAVDTDTFQINPETSTLNLIAVPQQALLSTIGDFSLLPGYDEKRTIVDEINVLYDIVQWKEY